MGTAVSREGLDSSSRATRRGQCERFVFELPFDSTSALADLEPADAEAWLEAQMPKLIAQVEMSGARVRRPGG